MRTQTEQYLTKLYMDYFGGRKQHTEESAFFKDRPKTITYDNGLKIILERDMVNYPKKSFDIITIQTPKGNFTLPKDIYAWYGLKVDDCIHFCDSGNEFWRHSTPFEDLVEYGSLTLQKTKKNIYSLLHEIGHITGESQEVEARRPILEMEQEAWEKADMLLDRMGLILFENETEKTLYRDVNLRNYDPFDEENLVQDSLIVQITQDRFDYRVLRALIQAAELGLNLEELCNRLIDEKNVLLSLK